MSIEEFPGQKASPYTAFFVKDMIATGSKNLVFIISYDKQLRDEGGFLTLTAILRRRMENEQGNFRTCDFSRWKIVYAEQCNGMIPRVLPIPEGHGIIHPEQDAYFAKFLLQQIEEISDKIPNLKVKFNQNCCENFLTLNGIDIQTLEEVAKDYPKGISTLFLETYFPNNN